MQYTKIYYGNINSISKYRVTSVKVGFAMRSLDTRSGLKAEGVANNNRGGEDQNLVASEEV